MPHLTFSQVRLGDKLVASSADRTLTFFDLSFERLKLEGKCSVQCAPMTLLVYVLPPPSRDVCVCVCCCLAMAAFAWRMTECDTRAKVQ